MVARIAAISYALLELGLESAYRGRRASLLGSAVLFLLGWWFCSGFSPYGEAWAVGWLRPLYGVKLE